ncbi:E3 ubiquitin-protein ligase MARCH7 [Gadus morhua]|uniref:Uncharacterized protein n=1 Tax=Gadus morhua TaxID=8049 RepID=A0A8C5CMB5_GADMO|nr:E3 ubiquitin-protein ligase MARCH1 [Gadus morhua]
MPVHQIVVAPVRDPKSSPRSKDKLEGAKARKASSESRSSSIPKGKGSTAGLGTALKTSAIPPSPQDIGSSGPRAPLEASAAVTIKASLSKPPRPVAATTASQSTQQKKTVKRRHRRKKEVSDPVGGPVDAPAEGQGAPAREGSPSPDPRERKKERGEEPAGTRVRKELPAPRPKGPPSDTTSEDEAGGREDRSWSKERARRGRRRSGGGRDRPPGPRVRPGGEPGADKEAPMELQTMGSHEGGGGGEETGKPPECEAGPEKRRSSGGPPGAPSPGGSSSLAGEEEQMTYQGTYQEQGAGGGDSAVPTGTKHCGANGDTGQTLCSEDSDAEVCRICHCEGEEEYPLITPCWCTGSLRFVHRACLNQWIKSSDTRCCELCKYDFIMETELKPLFKWERLHMTKGEWRKILCSVVFHLLSLSCVTWSAYVLCKRTAEDFRLGKEDQLWRLALLKYYSAEGVMEWPFWTKVTVVGMGIISGLFFMHIQGGVYLQLWRRLKAFNRIITVQNCPEKGLHPPRDPKPRVKPTGDTVVVPVGPSPAQVPEEQMDSDQSVEAAVAPV